LAAAAEKGPWVVAQDHIADADGDVHHWLQSVGVESLCQWDVLTFVYRHRTTLLRPLHLARLLGYRMEPVVAALDSLATLQLLRWSESRGVSLYQFTVPPSLSRSDAVERLLALSEHRSGRLLLGKHLGRGDRTPDEGLQAARRFLDDSDAILDTINRFCGRTSETRH